MPGNDAEELAKVPFLMEHFEEHSLGGGLKEFVHFLRDHYDASMPDGEDHQQLPFAKHLQPCLVFVVPSFTISFGADFSLLPAQSDFPEEKSSLLSGYSEAWQPPRLG